LPVVVSHRCSARQFSPRAIFFPSSLIPTQRIKRTELPALIRAIRLPVAGFHTCTRPSLHFVVVANHRPLAEKAKVSTGSPSLSHLRCLPVVRSSRENPWS